MPETQRQEIHAIIVKVFVDDRAKSEVLAFHFLRAGNKKKGCEMLYEASINANMLFAYKEASNNLGQAIAESPTKLLKAAYMSYSAWIRSTMFDSNNACKLATEALEIFAEEMGDDSLLPSPKNIPSDQVYKQARMEWEGVPGGWKMPQNVSGRSILIGTDSDLRPKTVEELMLVYCRYCICSFFFSGNPSFIKWLVMKRGFTPADVMVGGKLDRIFDVEVFRLRKLCYDLRVGIPFAQLSMLFPMRGMYLREPEVVQMCYQHVTTISHYMGDQIKNISGEDPESYG